MKTETTKVCKCGNTNLVLLQTENKKHCLDCGAVIEWFLDDGQKPLV